jgi:cyclopropane-fatty-acyl-phospholipid synthase
MATLEHGSVEVLETWSGRSVKLGHGALVATIAMRDPGFYGVLAKRGSIGAAEAYAEGLWDCAQLPELVSLLVRNRDVLASLEGGLARLSAPVQKLFHTMRPNSRKGSRKNIAAHYDLGNDFFELWLDETLTYSSGFFENDASTLAEASTAKLDRLCRKLDLQSNDRLLEIGCGWGSMALHAATHYGCHVTSTTISQEQFDLASERVREAGLADRVQIVMEDYRDLRGRWDKLVSVEMIEAVGAPHLDEYTRTCNQLLKRDGLFALQAITIADQHYEEARDSVDFIKRHIFPGSFIPSVTAILNSTTKSEDLRLVHLEDMGPHYARTLACWRHNLRASWNAARQLNYGEEFLRLWEYYLAYCEGGFAERFLGVSQMLFTRPDSRRSPVLPPLAS